MHTESSTDLGNTIFKKELFKSKPQPIYVVGFPKSGNTWLTRLLADVLRARVRSKDMRNNIEVASDVNERLFLPKKTEYEIAKVHLIPDFFLKEVDPEPQRIVYIFRDIRDVAISAFFYWNKNYQEDDVRTSSFSSLFSNGPRALFDYYRYRRKLLCYIRNLCIGNIEWFKKNTGIWSEHISKWRNISRQLTDVRFVFISYEELRHNPSRALLYILSTLNLPEPTHRRLEVAIERQSFKRLKKYFREETTDARIPFGRQFNLKFLRKGSVGDWKNFLSFRMGHMIKRHHGEMLLELGYESDPHWYKKLRFDLV